MLVYSVKWRLQRPDEDSPPALMGARAVVAFEKDGGIEARLVLRGFTDHRLGKAPILSPTASTCFRRLFLGMPDPSALQILTGDIEHAFFYGSLVGEDKQTGEDSATDAFSALLPDLVKRL